MIWSALYCYTVLYDLSNYLTLTWIFFLYHDNILFKPRIFIVLLLLYLEETFLVFSKISVVNCTPLVFKWSNFILSCHLFSIKLFFNISNLYSIMFYLSKIIYIISLYLLLTLFYHTQSHKYLSGWTWICFRKFD